MSDKFVFLSQFYVNFRKNDFEYRSIIPLNLIKGTTYQFPWQKLWIILKYIAQLPTYFYEITVIFVNPFSTEIFIFLLIEYVR